LPTELTYEWLTSRRTNDLEEVEKLETFDLLISSLLFTN